MIKACVSLDPRHFLVTGTLLSIEKTVRERKTGMRKMARFWRKTGMKKNSRLMIPTKENNHKLISKLNK
jgi:hypothetical protein